MAWLHATPKGSSQSRLEKCKDPEAFVLKMPDLDGADYIIQMLREAGMVMSNGMGPMHLSWQEIESWIRVTGSTPCLWERLLIRELSEVYVAEFNAASDPNRADPYVHVVDPAEVDRAVVSSRLKNALRSFARPQKT